MGKVLFLFLLLISAGVSPIFEFQVQQEDLISFQRKLVEICGHQEWSAVAVK